MENEDKDKRLVSVVSEIERLRKKTHDLIWEGKDEEAYWANRAYLFHKDLLKKGVEYVPKF